MSFRRTVRADADVASCMASGCTSAASIASWYQRATWTSGSASTSASSSGTSSTPEGLARPNDEVVERERRVVAAHAHRARRRERRAADAEIGGVQQDEPVLRERELHAAER